MMKHPDLHTRWQGWLLLLLALFVITPFVILCFYAHPSADDWYMAAAGRDREIDRRALQTDRRQQHAGEQRTQHEAHHNKKNE